MSSIKGTHIDGDVSVGRNVATGGNARIAGGCVIDHDLQVKGWLNAPNIKSSCKGLFLSSLTLVSSYPTASSGDWALVKPSGSGDVFPAEVWLWSDVDGWHDSGKTTEGYETFDISELRAAIASLEGYVEDLASSIESLTYEEDEYDPYPRDGYWGINNDNLRFVPVKGWHATNPIPIEVGDEFTITSTILVGTSGHVLFNANKELIGLLQTETGPTRTQFTITQEQWDSGARYVGFSFKPADTPSVLKKVAFSPQKTERRFGDIEGRLEGIEGRLEGIAILDAIRPVYEYSHGAPLAFRNGLSQLDHDIEIILLGDSVTGYTHVVSIDEEPDAPNRPCGMQRNGLSWYLWNSICHNKPQCDRWDSRVNSIIESGNFVLSDYKKFNNEPGYSPSSDVLLGEFSQDNCVYRECDEDDCTVRFTWSTDDYEYFAIIHRLGIDGSARVAVEVNSGEDERVQVFDERSGNWVEANNYEFSQHLDLVARSAGGHSHWVRQQVLKFRKTSLASGYVTIDIMNRDYQGGYMYYWGSEMWNGNTVRIINAGKGGRSSNLQLFTLHDEIAYRNPDLVVYQLPVWNELKYGGNYSESWNDYHKQVIDLIKAQSDNWSKYQMMIFIPHTQVADWDKDRNKRFQKNGKPGEPLTDEVSMTEVSREACLLSQYDANVPVFNLNPCIIDFAHSLGIDMETLLGSTSSAITDGTTAEVRLTDRYTADGVHMSKTGAKFTANCLLPILR